jgi:endonuclease/exonuclease/phosphatase family metal-dependent hydrolase
MRLDKTEYKEYIPNSRYWNSKILNIKLNHISDVICDLNADIIDLEEIENKNALKLLQKRLKLVGCEYRYSAITNTPNSSIQVAILSKYKIDYKRDIKVVGERYILEIGLKVFDKNLIIFANHWKSKFRGGEDSRRIKSAKALRDRLDELKDREYIILGDLNSIHKEKAVDEVLNRDKDLYNLWLNIKSSKRWSVNYYGKREAIDYILVSKSMLDGRGIDYINDSFKVFIKRYLFTKKGYIDRWSSKKARGYSDHLPIYAEFSLKPYKKPKAKKIVDMSIDELLKNKEIDGLVRLKNIKVVSKNKKYSATIKDDKNSSIYIYKMAKDLRLNSYYDLVIDEVKEYKERVEIVGIVNFLLL